MNFHVLTLFPEMIMQGIGTSITGRAMSKGIIGVEAVNIRDYTLDKHGKVDDYPYGGGAGMVMGPQPVFDAVCAVKERCTADTPVVYLTPQGTVFHQQMAQDFSKYSDLILLCGHYEGIDERVLDMVVTHRVSVGDYVLTGGELPAMVMIDCISRLVPGVLNNDVSADIESFHDNLLEYPQYTRPEVFRGEAVPEVLLSGHHAKIEEWRRCQSIRRTAEIRPDLLEKANLSKKEQIYLETLRKEKSEDII